MADEKQNVANAPVLGIKKEANANSVVAIKGFTYIKEYAMIVVDDDGNNVRVIIGDKGNFPITEMMTLKGHDVELRYRDAVTTSQGTYHRCFIECIL